jgi:hypothetical protein
MKKNKIAELGGFKVGEVVRGIRAGVFVILGFEAHDQDNMGARIKEVNPNNHAERARGSLVLPFRALVKL